MRIFYRREKLIRSTAPNPTINGGVRAPLSINPEQAPAVRTGYIEGLIVTFGLVVLLAVSFYDVVFLDKTFKVSTAVSQALPTGVYGQEQNIPPHYLTFGVDSTVYEEPTFAFIKHHLWQGSIPLWNPYQACGYPLVAMIQAGMFYPLNFIHYIFPDAIAWDLLILVRFFLAGFFAYWLMRSLRFSPVASATSAIVYMLSGPLLLIQNATASVDILFPLLLLAFEYLLKRPGKKAVVFIAGVVALMIIAGAPEHGFFNNVCGLLYFAFRFWTTKKGKGLGLMTVRLGLTYLLALGLSAIALFPFLSNFTSEFWNGHPPGMGTLVEENTSRWLSIILPHFFQHEPMSRDWIPSGWLGGYLGIIPVALACFSLWNRHRRGLNYFCVILAFLIVGKSYGLWFINWIGYLPLFHIARYAYHTPPLVALLVAMAAGMGVRSIELNRNAFAKGLVFTVVVLGLIGWQLALAKGAAFWPLAKSASIFAVALLLTWQIILFLRDRAIVSRRVGAVAVLVFVFVELLCYIHREKPTRFVTHPTVPYIEFIRQSPQPGRVYGLAWTLFPDTATGYEIDDLGIFDGLLMRRYVNFINELVLPNNFVNDLRPTTLRVVPIAGSKEFLDLLNLKYIVAPVDMELPDSYRESEQLNQVYTGEVNVFERGGVMPRAFVVHRAIFEPQAASAPTFSSLRYYRNNLRQMVILNHAPIDQITRALEGTPLETTSSAEITLYSPNEVRISAQMSHPGFLVLTDTYHPDWRAVVDGKPATIFETDNLFRSVFLPAGSHTVTFVFRPVSFYWGCLVTLLSLAASLWLLFGFAISQKR